MNTHHIQIQVSNYNPDNYPTNLHNHLNTQLKKNTYRTCTYTHTTNLNPDTPVTVQYGNKTLLGFVRQPTPPQELQNLQNQNIQLKPILEINPQNTTNTTQPKQNIIF